MMPHHWRPLAHEQNSIFKCKRHTCTLHDPWGQESMPNIYHTNYLNCRNLSRKAYVWQIIHNLKSFNTMSKIHRKLAICKQLFMKLKQLRVISFCYSKIDILMINIDTCSILTFGIFFVIYATGVNKQRTITKCITAITYVWRKRVPISFVYLFCSILPQ